MVAVPQTILSFIPALNTLLSYHTAPESFDSPFNTVAIAEFDSDIKGYVKFSAIESGEVNVDVNLSGLPNEGGPFLYHIHEFAVPSDGDCYATGGHLNPFHGIAPCSSASTNAYCEAGDLSGKHGFINGNELSDSYVEKYLSLNPYNKAFVGGLSVTIHLADNTRIACSNIKFDTEEESVEISKKKSNKKSHQKKSSHNSSNSSNSTTSTLIGAALVNGASYGILAAGAAGLAAALL